MKIDIGPRLTSCTAVLLMALTSGLAPVQAAPGARLLGTSGASTIEGAAGGGIVPWSLLAGYGEDQQFGATAWYTTVRPGDFTLQAFGAATSLYNRIEVSAGKQSFDIGAVTPGETLDQSILGAKLRLGGDLVYSQLPQISLGVQYKNSETFAIPDEAGARDDSGMDVYLAVSKLWLDGPLHRSAFLNATLRATRANQTGLLGHGGDRRNTMQLVGEVSAGLFLTRQWVLGAEYRQKPDNLGQYREDDWYDVFVGWFPNKRFSVVAAYSDLGSINGLDDQRGMYLSLQLSH